MTTKGTINLPDGWKSEQPSGGNHTVIRHSDPMGGFVTIDWDARRIRSGWSTTGPSIVTRSYTSAGWRKKIVEDAVAHLRRIYDLPT